MILTESIAGAIEYLDGQGVPIPPDLYLRAYRVGAIKADSSLDSINAKYHDAITQALTGYFEGDGLPASRNAFKRGTTEAFVKAFDLGWIQGGQELPIDKEALAWFDARIEAEYGFISQLFEQAKQLKKEDGFDFFSWVTQKADSYTKTLLSIYNSAILFAKKTQMLTWRLGDTEVHCATCLKLNGGSHRASWYIARNYIPRQPNADLECKGYNCDCYLETKDGEFVTL